MFATSGRRFIEMRRAALVPKVHPLPPTPRQLTLEEQQQTRLWIVSVEGMKLHAHRSGNTYLAGMLLTVWSELLIRLGVITEAEWHAYLNSHDTGARPMPKAARV